MLKNIIQLVILFGLSTILAYILLLKKDELSLTSQRLIADLHEFWVAQSPRKSKQLDVAKLPDNYRPIIRRQPVQVIQYEGDSPDKEIAQNQQGFQCTTTPLEKVTVKKQAHIYSWKDENGKIHFGDSAFQKVATKEVNLKHRTQIEYFNLKISGDEQPTLFTDQLSTGINKVYNLLSNLIPEEKLEKVTVDLKIFNDLNAYRNYSAQFSKALGSQTTGFYFMRLNQAVVHKRNDVQAGQVALHEATHVINAGIFGYIPRWLNEGIAEYTENMTVTGTVAEITPNTSWSTQSRIKTRYLVSFDELFSQQSSWNDSKRRSYYATSWSLVYFLMSSEEDRQWLGNLLTEKASKRCEHIITRDYIDRRYPGGIDNLQQRFNHWLSSASTLATHRY